MTTDLLPTDWQRWITAQEFAQLHNVTERTVKRWLGDDLVSGAYKDPRGRWQIPHDAPRPDVNEIASSRIVAVPEPAPALSYEHAPSFLPVDEAARALGISAHAIREHRTYFDVVPFGSNGSLVVPLATIRRIRGE